MDPVVLNLSGDPVESFRKKLDRIRSDMGGTAKLGQLCDLGRLNVRERFELLLDPGSFSEVGTFSHSDRAKFASVVPKARRRAYDGRQRAAPVLDEAVFEIRPLVGRGLNTEFSRLDGDHSPSPDAAAGPMTINELIEPADTRLVRHDRMSGSPIAGSRRPKCDLSPPGRPAESILIRPSRKDTV